MQYLYMQMYLNTSTNTLESISNIFHFQDVLLYR